MGRNLLRFFEAGCTIGEGIRSLCQVVISEAVLRYVLCVKS